jgi:dTDP-4-dehydrorhamnose 3,5-epimerase
MVYIPKGFAHGYCTLSEVSEVLYKVDHAYDRSREGGLLWSDPAIGIEWPVIGRPTLSEKDANAMSLETFLKAQDGLDPG